MYEAYKTSKGLAYAVDVTVSYCLVKGIGDCTDTELIIPAEHDGLPVVGIAGNAFKSCGGIKRVVLSEGLRMICPGAFSGCEGITDVYLPDSLISIGYMAFCGCKSLKSIRIPRSVDRIGGYALKDCIRLTSIDYGGSIKEWIDVGTEYSFDDGTGNYTLYCSDRRISRASARYLLLEKLQKAAHRMTVPYANRPKSEGLEYAECEDNKSLYVVGLGSCTDKEIYIPQDVGGKRVIGIEKKAFKCCKGITSVDVPFGVELIGSSAFSGCSSLSKISLPESLTVMENGAFIGCEALQSIRLGGNLLRIAPHTFMGCSTLCSVTLPDSIESIGMSAFEGCSALSSVHLPPALSHVGMYAFKNCACLTSVFYPKTCLDWDVDVTNEANIEVLCEDTE